MISELESHALPIHGITLITAVDLAIKEIHRISVLELSSNIGISAGSIDTIIHEHLLYSEVTDRWVPKMLTEQHK